jgi:hypothetical protein
MRNNIRTIRALNSAAADVRGQSVQARRKHAANIAQIQKLAEKDAKEMAKLKKEMDAKKKAASAKPVGAKTRRRGFVTGKIGAKYPPRLTSGRRTRVATAYPDSIPRQSIINRMRSAGFNFTDPKKKGK